MNEKNIKELDSQTVFPTIDKSTNGILLEAHMMKRARNRGLRSVLGSLVGYPWANRKFVLLDDKSLQYFDESDDLKGTVGLHGAVAKQLFGPRVIPFSFMVQDADSGEELILIAANSQIECDRWLNAINSL